MVHCIGSLASFRWAVKARLSPGVLVPPSPFLGYKPSRGLVGPICGEYQKAHYGTGTSPGLGVWFTVGKRETREIYHPAKPTGGQSVAYPMVTVSAAAAMTTQG